MKLIIGTAQFGRDYGIANETGKVPYDEVLKIMQLAHDNGIEYYDTSNDYGNSESIIGKASEELGIKPKIISKLYMEFDKEEPGGILIGVECMLERLKTDCIDSLMIHQPYWLMEEQYSDFVCGMLMVLKGKGYTKKIGVSVGDPMHAVEILEKYKLDVVQVPYNVFDQRINSRFVTDALHGVEVHMRSVFLQGLLLMDPSSLPEYFDPIKETLVELRNMAEETNVSMLKMCLDFSTYSGFGKTVVGVDSVQQLQEILDVYNSPKCTTYPHGSWIKNDPKFINPGFWPVGGWWK